MARKPKPIRDDPAESKRFIETAREVGADENGESFERVFKAIVSAGRPKSRDRAPSKANWRAPK